MKYFITVILILNGLAASSQCSLLTMEADSSFTIVTNGDYIYKRTDKSYAGLELSIKFSEHNKTYQLTIKYSSTGRNNIPKSFSLLFENKNQTVLTPFKNTAAIQSKEKVLQTLFYIPLSQRMVEEISISPLNSLSINFADNDRVILDNLDDKLLLKRQVECLQTTISKKLQ